MSKPIDMTLLAQKNKQQYYTRRTNPLITKNTFFFSDDYDFQYISSDFNLEFRQRPVHTLSAPFQKTDPYLKLINRHFLKVLGIIFNPMCGFISSVDQQPNFQTPTQPLQPFEVDNPSPYIQQKPYHYTDVPLCWGIDEKCAFLA